MILPHFLRQLTLLAGGISLIAVTSLKLTGLMLVSLPVLTVVAVVFGRKIRRIAREAQDRLAETATVVEETLQGILNVKSFANESYELFRYHSGLQKYLSTTLHTARLRAAFIAFIILALYGSIVLVLWSGAPLAANRTNHVQASLRDLSSTRLSWRVPWANSRNFTARSKKRWAQLSACGSSCARAAKSKPASTRSQSPRPLGCGGRFDSRQCVLLTLAARKSRSCAGINLAAAPG